MDLAADAQLCQGVKEGDSLAWERLCERHRPFIIRYCRKWHRPGLIIDDLKQIAWLALREAALRYDPGRKRAFLTYAMWWVRKYFYIEDEKNSRFQSIANEGHNDEIFNEIEARPASNNIRLNKLTKRGLKVFFKKVRREGVSLDECRTLYLVYNLGSKKQQEKWKNHLWMQWLHQKGTLTAERCLRLVRYTKHERKSPYTGDKLSDALFTSSELAKQLRRTETLLCQNYWHLKRIGAPKPAELVKWIRTEHDVNGRCPRCKRLDKQPKLFRGVA